MNINELLFRCRDALQEGKSQLEIQGLLEDIDKATTQYPDGQLSPEDGGAMGAKVGIKDGRIVILFDERVKWIAMTPDEAMGFATLLAKKAVKAGCTTPFVITLGGAGNE